MITQKQIDIINKIIILSIEHGNGRYPYLYYENKLNTLIKELECDISWYDSCYPATLEVFNSPNKYDFDYERNHYYPQLFRK